MSDSTDLSDLEGLDLPFDVHKVRPMCHACIRRQVEKYKNHVDEKKRPLKNRFIVPCQGALINPVDQRLKNTFSVSEWEEVQAIFDPVLWAKKYVVHSSEEPWIARFYQEEVMRCTSSRRALRISRRTGKTDLVSVEICYHMFTKKDQRILVTAPQKVHVEEIIDRIRGFIGRNANLHNEVVRDVSSPYYEIQVANGSRVRGFPLGTRGKSEGVAVRGQNADKIYCFPRDTLVNTSEFALKPIQKLTLEDSILGGDEKDVRLGDIKNLGVRKDILITIPTDLNVVRCTPDHPLFNGVSDIPAEDADEVIVSLAHREMTYDRTVVLARLLGYLYGDGWISNNAVGFSGGREDIRQILEDLAGLGIPKTQISTRVLENKKRGIKGITSQFSSVHAYVLFKDDHPEGKKVLQPLRVPDKIMNGRGYIKTAFLSGLFSAEGEGLKYQINQKTPKTIRMSMYSSKEEWITNWIEDISQLLNCSNIKHRVDITQKVKELEDDEDRWIGMITIVNSKDNLSKFIEKIGCCYSMDKTITFNIYKLFRAYEDRWKADSWKKNRAICKESGCSREVGEKLGFPKSTVKYHRHLYNDLYSEPLLEPNEYIDKIRWRDHYVILPVKKEGVRYSEELVDVYNITSGASNRFFAGGMFTHNCDEMDFVDNKAVIGGLFPILQTTPETTMTGFSTPTGFKSAYYAICEENPYYKEFHYDYKVLPHWQTVEKDRPQYTEDEWIHEMLAEWGSAESGVYKPSYIDRSLRSYLYEEQQPRTGWRYIIGVDWNEKHGAELVVVGENVSGGYYQVVEAVAVGKAEFTQLKSIETLILLHRKWFPVKIYVDAGNGCLHEDSLVYTSNGASKIKDISIGDKVLSHHGVFRKVTSAVPTGKKNSYLLKSAFCLPVKVSERHRHIIYRSIDRFNDFNHVQSSSEFCSMDIDLKEFTTAELDKNKDFVIVPKQDVSKAKDSYVVDLVEELKGIPHLKYDNNYIWTKHSYNTTPKLSANKIIETYNTSRATVQRTRRKLQNGGRLAPAERKLAKKLFIDHGEDWYVLENKKISRYIDILDPEFLNLYGWYLSEGHAGENNIEISQMPFHYKDEFKHLMSYCSSKWDISVITKTNGISRLFILSSLLTEFFKRIGGSRCYNKFIDQRILENNGYDLLPSLFWGDGHKHQHGLTISMTSPTLVMQIRQMLINNDLLSGLHYIEPRERADGYNCAPQLMLYLNAIKNNVEKINKIFKANVKIRNGIVRRKYIELDDCFLVPIKKLESIGEVNNMYDLTVEEDSSFCVNGFATHNSTNEELIRKMSYDQRRPGGDKQIAKLLDIVKKYDAGSSIEIKDPVTSKRRKTPAKPYMVNSAVRVFEQDKMRISSADKILENQFRNYMIERISPTGTPVYGMKDKKIKDHRLDAFNLAMVAYFKEFGGLQQDHVITTAISAANPMTKLGGTPRKDSMPGRPDERRLDSSADRSVIMRGAYLPARADIGRNIPVTQSGWEYDLEEHYERLNQHRRNRRDRVTTDRGNPIRRTNI